jgi:glutaminase
MFPAMTSSLVTDLLQAVHDACVDDRSGVSRDPIPELARIDPDAFGICVATVDGQVYEVGDTRARFPIQSISKAFTYGLALEDRGAETVAGKIDVEPSGEPYNEISVDPRTGRPRNPMINAGAITASSLVAGDTPAEQFAHVRTAFSGYADRRLELDEDVLRTEVRTGDRNRAIGYLLREFGTLECEPDDALDVYLRQCSLLVDCRDLALMAATLANAGIQPRSGERLAAVETVDRILSVMTTCGMYDAAGDWVAEVGLPAKSGVGGGIIAVLPGQIAVAVFSPRLDEHGNSVRGVAACRRLSRELELHFLHVPRGARSAVDNVTGLTGTPSLRERPAATEEVLRRHADRVQIFGLHGDLQFAGAEAIVRRAEQAAGELDVIVFDARRVGNVSDVTWRLLLGLRVRLDEHDCEVAIIASGGQIDARPGEAATVDPAPVFARLETAVAWAEDRLLARYGEGVLGEVALELRDHPMIARVDPGRIDDLCARLQTRTVSAGTRVVRAGDPATGLYLLLSGRARSSVPTASGSAEPVATLPPGTCFGQASLVTGRPHAFDVDAEERCELAVLTPEAFASLAEDDPPLRAALIDALLHAAYDTVDRFLRIAAARAAG